VTWFTGYTTNWLIDDPNVSNQIIWQRKETNPCKTTVVQPVTSRNFESSRQWRQKQEIIVQMVQTQWTKIYPIGCRAWTVNILPELRCQLSQSVAIIRTKKGYEIVWDPHADGWKSWKTGTFLYISGAPFDLALETWCWWQNVRNVMLISEMYYTLPQGRYRLVWPGSSSEICTVQAR